MDIGSIQDLRAALVVALAAESFIASSEAAEQLHDACKLAQQRGLSADRIEPLRMLLSSHSTANDLHDAIATLDLLAAIEITAEAVREKLLKLPVVRLHPPEIECGGKVYQVSTNQALAFHTMRERYPDRVSLSAEVGHHPDRYIGRLPEELRQLIDTDQRGSRLSL
ncbi:MAG: hypothetical protein WD738_23885 [Pirellulales bacterium]